MTVTASALNVMLVDDHAVVRMGFRLLLEGCPDIHVVAEAESGEEACRLYPASRADVVVLDLSMPGMGGLEALNRLLAKAPRARILVLSAHDDTMHARRVLKAGALGYLSKRGAADDLIKAVRLVAQGKRFVDAAIAQRIAVQRFADDQEPVEVLSEKEFNVFLALASGKSVAEIADVMCLSPRTVGTHLYNIKHKLGASNSAELALIAIRAGLIEP